MRKISLYICSFLMLSLLACEDQLEQTPLSEIGSNNFYRNATDFQNAVNGTYAQLRPYPERHYYLSEIRSDNFYATTEEGVRTYEPLNNFNRNVSANELVEEAWNNNFNGIMRANTVLDRLNEEVVPDDDLRNRFEAEARFLRAFYYFDLVRWFGELPIYERFVTPEEALEVPRSPVVEVYELILSDLDFAIENLPDEYDGSDQGRATSWAAKGLLARIHLTRSGPKFGIEGPGLGVDEYTQALTLLDDIINNGPFGWVDNYAAIFAYNNENNQDIVFDIQYQSGGVGVGAIYPSEMTPNNYFAAVGIPFPGLTIKPISDDFIASFEEEDVRREVSIQEGFVDQNGNVDSRPFYRKFLDEDEHGIDRFDWPINFPVIRYTDVLMMKAEAILQGASGSQQEVDDIVNQVRERAGLEEVSNVSLEMLMEERRREFAAEGHRWHDLVRSGLVLETMNAWLPTEDARNVMAENIDENFIIYPIPFNQLTVKQGLYQQNPLYN